MYPVFKHFKRIYLLYPLLEVIQDGSVLRHGDGEVAPIEGVSIPVPRDHIPPTDCDASIPVPSDNHCDEDTNSRPTWRSLFDWRSWLTRRSTVDER